MSEGWSELERRLRRDGFLRGPARGEPLGGGVSSDIYLVHAGRRRFVVKRALPQLRVRAHWRSDPVRNRYEQRYLRYVGARLPRAVPRILFGGEDRGYFAMEHLGGGFRTWKADLLAGRCDPRVARQAAAVLARVHASSRGRTEVARRFATVRNFRQLRTDPYLRTAARRHPRLARALRAEAARLEATRRCLVHGDFSPKNILIGPGRLVLLDCEVAWYGDTAFDLAFVLHHLCLKALHHAPREPGIERLFRAFAEVYFARAGWDREEAFALDRRTARLTLMLMLARIDGKSPVEYLAEPARRNLVRRFVSARLPEFGGSLEDLRQAWFSALRAARLSR